MPLLRIVCPPDSTVQIVGLLEADAGASGISVVHGAGRPRGDLVHADVPRSSIDPLLAALRTASASGKARIHATVQPSESLLPEPPPSPDDDAMVWAEVVHDLHAAGRLSRISVLLVVVSSLIAAVGIVEGQLLLIVGAMALSPDYLPIANTYLALSRRAWRAAGRGVVTLLITFTAAAAAAWALGELLAATGHPTAPETSALRELTLFIAHPDTLSIVVALLAGVAGALAITLPGTRGLVGVLVSVTTIPAAANIGIALANRDATELAGAALQLAGNVAGLLAAGTVTLTLRHRGRVPRTHDRGFAGTER